MGCGCIWKDGRTDGWMGRAGGEVGKQADRQGGIGR